MTVLQELLIGIVMHRLRPWLGHQTLQIPSFCCLSWKLWCALKEGLLGDKITSPARREDKQTNVMHYNYKWPSFTFIWCFCSQKSPTEAGRNGFATLLLGCLQGSTNRRAPGLVNFVPALAYHFCFNLPAAFTQPGARLLVEPCTLWGISIPSKINHLTWEPRKLCNKHWCRKL